jgi:arylsulfatase A-like enzyme
VNTTIAALRLHERGIPRNGLHPVLQRFWPLYTLLAVMLALGATLRVILWWRFGQPAGVAAADLAWIVPVGFADDFVEGLYLLTPYALYIAVLPHRWYGSRPNQFLMAAGNFLAIFGMMYLAVVEFYFFDEFDARFNLVAVDYLVYPREVLGDIRTEYPVIPALLATVSGTLALAGGLRRHLLHGLFVAVPFVHRLAHLGVHASLLLAAVLWFGTDSVSLSLSGNRVAIEIADNGISSLFRALRTMDLDYRKYYRTMDDARALELVRQQLALGGGTLDALSDGRVDRSFPASAAGLGRANVVVVVMESFGAEFSRLYGSSRDWTPNFDRLAQQGTWFSQVYASGTRTVRGLEAITASLPPIPSKSILRRPGSEHIATWGRIMADNGYHTSFLYGGYGYFDDMNHYFGENGFQVLDRRDIDHVRFENIWGVSDEDLYDKALAFFDTETSAGRPFFSVIMNTSNHKPYTFRPGVPGVPEEGGGREAGVRYADFAVGRFLADAAARDWFEDTIFVVLADHGARVYGEAKIPMASYRIPWMVYAPGRVPVRRVDALAAQIDVVPTVMGMLGLPYRAPFFGQDVFAMSSAQRLVFVNHNHDAGLYRNGKLVVLGLGKTAETFSYDPVTDQTAPVAADEELENLAIAFYQVAFDLFRRHEFT